MTYKDKIHLEKSLRKVNRYQAFLVVISLQNLKNKTQKPKFVKIYYRLNLIETIYFS